MSFDYESLKNSTQAPPDRATNIYCVIHGHHDSGYFGPSELCDSREWFATLEEAKDSYLNGKHKADWKAILALDLGTLQESQVVLEKAPSS